MGDGCEGVKRWVCVSGLTHTCEQPDTCMHALLYGSRQQTTRARRQEQSNLLLFVVEHIEILASLQAKNANVIMNAEVVEQENQIKPHLTRSC